MPRKRIPTAEKGGVPPLSPSEAFRQGLAADPESAIQRLKSSDMRFWTKVRDAVIVPYLRKSRYGEMARKKNVDDDEVYGYVYTMMVHNGKLNEIREKNQLARFLEQYARKYVQMLYAVRKRKVDEEPISEGGWAEWERNHVHEILLAEKKAQQRERISAAVRKLWKENPKRAYVLVMKTKNCLSSREVKDFCGLSSELNVNKIFERSKTSMRGNLSGGT